MLPVRDKLRFLSDAALPGGFLRIDRRRYFTHTRSLAVRAEDPAVLERQERHYCRDQFDTFPAP